MSLLSISENSVFVLVLERVFVSPPFFQLPRVGAAISNNGESVIMKLSKENWYKQGRIAKGLSLGFFSRGMLQRSSRCDLT